jgi:hypothetical protein
VLSVVVIGLLSFVLKDVKGASGIEGRYRVPVISPLEGDPVGLFYITRIECTENLRDPNNPRDDIKKHTGTPGSRFMDISLGGEVDKGVPVYASGSGKVDYAGELPDFGKNVVIKDDDVAFRYAHLSKIYVSDMMHVNKGDLIGLIGDTGNSSGSHLHWEAWPVKQGTTFDLMLIPGVNLIDATTGKPCTASNVGTISGSSRFQWNSCSEFYAMGLSNVVLFDHKDCRGNYAVLPGTGKFYLLGRFAAETDINDPNNAYLVMVFSDGQENASKKWNSSRLAERIQEFNKTNRWTFTYVGANQDLAVISESLNVDHSNMYRGWSADDASSVQMMADSKSGLENYMSFRKCGGTSVKNFYDPNGVINAVDNTPVKKDSN